MKFIPLLVLVFLSNIVSASDEFSPAGARSASMGYASVTLSDAWSACNNQAGLYQIKKPLVGFAFQNQFMIKELSTKTAIGVLPTKSGTFALSYSYFGYNLYNRSKTGLAYVKQLAEHFAASVQFDYLHTHVGEGYGNKSNVTFELGMLTNLTSQIILGVHLYNPISTKLTENSTERLPTIMKLGLSYQPSEKFDITAEADKELNFKTIIHTGFEYKVIPKLYLRAGMETNPMLTTFGFGLLLKKTHIDFSAGLNPVLGCSTNVSVSYDL